MKSGNSFSLNGVPYCLTSRIHVVCRLSMGFFTNDEPDFAHSGADYFYIQNLLLTGSDF